VVIGGQLFSKSLRGFTSYKMELAGHEGWVMALGLIALPCIILAVFVKLFLRERPGGQLGATAKATSQPIPSMLQVRAADGRPNIS
jgi:hypothetical protein